MKKLALVIFAVLNNDLTFHQKTNETFGSIDRADAIDFTHEFEEWKLGILSVFEVKKTDPHDHQY